MVVLAGLVAIQSLVILGYGVYLVVEGVLGHPTSVGRAESAGGIVLAFGLALLLVPYGLIRLRRWSRTPTVMLQLLGFGLVYYLLEVPNYAVAIPLAMVSAAGLVMAFMPSVTAALFGERGGD